MHHKTWAEDQADFRRMTNATTIEVDGRERALTLNRELIDEEVNRELLPALHAYKMNPSLENLVPLVDGAIDTIYVVLDLLNTLHVPVDDCWRIVHARNMAKADPATGKANKRADGKILKPAGWFGPEAQLHELLLQAETRRTYGEYYMTHGIIGGGKNHG